MESVKIGFIGCGEVFSTFSKAMLDFGADVTVYDILLSRKGGLETIKKRLKTDEIQIASLAEMVKKSDYVLSTVTTQFAEDAAKSSVEHLEPGKVYIDLNSTSPSVKIKIAGIIQQAKADFVEGAILGAVGATGSKTRILTTGERGNEVAETLNNLGLNASYYASEIGKASMFKMLRSIFSKGLENLILELLIAGKKAGIEKDLWKDIMDFMSKKPFDKIASNWVQTHAVAYERRYHEMVQVVETMREIGVEPIMTSGTEAFFKRSLSLGLNEAFPEKPDSFNEVVDFMERRLEYK